MLHAVQDEMSWVRTLESRLNFFLFIHEDAWLTLASIRLDLLRQTLD